MRKHTRKGPPPQRNKILQERMMATMLAREAAAREQWEKAHPESLQVVDLNSLKEAESAESESQK